MPPESSQPDRNAADPLPTSSPSVSDPQSVRPWPTARLRDSARWSRQTGGRGTGQVKGSSWSVGKTVPFSEEPIAMRVPSGENST